MTHRIQNDKKIVKQESTSQSLYEKKNFSEIILVKNQQGYYEHDGLIYKHHASNNIHYFKCEWQRRKNGGDCKAKLSTKDFSPKLCKEGDQVKVFLLSGHSDQCPTVPNSENNPENKKKDLLNKAQTYTQTRDKIICYLEEHPEKTSGEIIKWMQSSMEPYLHLQDIQIQNLVYNHRKEMMITQENYARTHNKNNENLPFLRANILLNVKKGNTDVEYKIWIWSSEFQLGKLRLTDHIFIDGTFGIVPSGYKQLLNIAIIDKTTGDIIPVCWILSNSKDYQCYKYCLGNFKELVTRSGHLKWSLKYATSDFEAGLMKSLAKVFPEVRLIGCLFHFKQALWRTAALMGLKSTKPINTFENEELGTMIKVTSDLIDELSRYSWQEKKSIEDYKKGIDHLRKNYEKYPHHIKLINFYESNWLKHLVEGTIYYKDLKGNLDRMKANSVLESYHAELKENLPLKPKWENLVQFFISQESKLVNLQSLRLKLGIIKENSQWGKKYFPSKSVRFKKSDFIMNEGLSDESEEDFVYDDKLEEKSFNCDSFVNDPQEKEVKSNEKPLSQKELKWITSKNNSCRYDSFLTIFCLRLLNKDEEFFNPEKFSKKTGYSEAYNMLYQTAKDINLGDFNSLFKLWAYLNLPIHPSHTGATKVCLDLEGIGNYGSVSVLLSLMNAIPGMTFNYLTGSYCKNCEVNKLIAKTFRVPIKFELVEANSIQGCFNAYIGRKDALHCFNCNKRGRSEQYLPINCPDYLIFYFQTEDGRINFEDKRFVYSEKLIFSKLGCFPTDRVQVRYDLIGTINYPYNYHFNSSVKDPLIYGNALKGWFIHDSSKNDGRLILVNEFIEITKEFPFVFFYKLNLDK